MHKRNGIVGVLIRRHPIIALIVISLVVIKGGFWLFNLDPARDLPTIRGYSIDLILYVVIIFIVQWLLKKLFPPETS